MEEEILLHSGHGGHGTHGKHGAQLGPRNSWNLEELEEEEEILLHDGHGGHGGHSDHSDRPLRPDVDPTMERAAIANTARDAILRVYTFRKRLLCLFCQPKFYYCSTPSFTIKQLN